MGNDSALLGDRECLTCAPEPVRYANDLLLTELARRVTTDIEAMNALLTNGRLDEAFRRALLIETNIEGLMCRLNDIRYERV